MSWSFWFSLSLIYLPIIGSIAHAKNCSSLPNNVWRKTGQSAHLSCTINSEYLKDNVQWFVFKKSFHGHLNLANKPQKYRLDGASLHIKSLDVHDSGIYHCAGVLNGQPASGAQVIGSGTALVVRDVNIMKYALLWSAFLILAIYSLTLMTFIILKKNGRNICICRRTCKSHKQNNLTKTLQFRAVVQELYNRRNLECSKHTPTRGPSPDEGTDNQFNPSTDGIYQNICGVSQSEMTDEFNIHS
ncbi:hypothetical protein LDENG_00107640 [Lucifuga dentata]|nr:hypothetical protein LDENG_00107640 [Lucifuga dentata]